MAAWNGDAATVRCLVEHGADLTVRDATFAATPLGWAEHRRQGEEERGDRAAVVHRLSEVIDYLRDRS